MLGILPYVANLHIAVEQQRRALYQSPESLRQETIRNRPSYQLLISVLARGMTFYGVCLGQSYLRP